MADQQSPQPSSSRAEELICIRTRVGAIKNDTHIDFAVLTSRQNESFYALWTTWGEIRHRSKNERIEVNTYDSLRNIRPLLCHRYLELCSESIAYECDCPVSRIILVVRVSMKDVREALDRQDPHLRVTIRSIREERVC